MRIFNALLVYLVITLSFSSQATEPDTEKNKSIKASTKTITIKSRVKGSQEQPNVTYIMPWQGISKPIMVNGELQKVQMPTFKPITPKNFKKQVNSYYQLVEKVNQSGK